MKNRKQSFLLRKTSLFFILLVITLTSLGLDNPLPVFGQASSSARQPTFSVDELSAYTQAPPVVLVVDENPDAQGIRQPNQNLAGAKAQSAAFEITFVPGGQTDRYGQSCQAFPAAAQSAFQAGADIWGQTIRSDVPITIRACWANLSQLGNVLGYSGVDTFHRDFLGAKVPNVWYQAALANALAGQDLVPSRFDMHITYNSTYSWYFGIDGNTPLGQYDLVTVAAHEIGHGLNFSGDGWQLSNSSWGIGGYDNNEQHYYDVYDLFMQDGAGTPLTAYPLPSSALGNALTSDNLWWNGNYARMANGGARVKMYAPPTWSGGSSYSHLDYLTYWNTINSLMVYALGAGSSQHNPGPVTACLLKDMGWRLVDDSPCHTIFADVPASYWAKNAIERLYAAGITGGCAAGLYCPENPVTRAQMAVFLLRGINGEGFTPPAATGAIFADVPTSHWAAAFVEQLAAEGITSGCAAGLYCPENPVTRAQMAVFLLKAKYGSSYLPPALGSGSGFNDVPDTHWAARWIKQLAAEGITSGCGAGNYCPENLVTRAQMAVFLVTTFNLP